MNSRLLPTFALAGALAASLAPAAPRMQEPAGATQPPTLGELLRRLRASDSDWAAREAAIEGLIEHHGADGAKQAASWLLGRYGAEFGRWEKERDRYLKDFVKRAPRAALVEREKKADEEIARLRAEARAVTARGELLKEHIVEEIDPRLERLGELLLLTSWLVLERDEELAAERRELDARLDDLLEWHGLWRLAADGWIRLDPEAAGEGAGARGEPPADPDGLHAALGDREDWECVLAVRMTDRDRETLLRNLDLRAEVRPEEYDGILEHNLIRIQLGLHAQRIDPKLCAAGRDHSTDMKTLGFFAHESPVEGKKTPGDRARNFGTSAGAENIAAGQEGPVDAVRAWWHSPGHHKNMLGGAERVGLGHFEGFWTEMFG